MILIIHTDYTKHDISYIHEILDELLTHNPLCDRECKNCKKKQCVKTCTPYTNTYTKYTPIVKNLTVDNSP